MPDRVASDHPSVRTLRGRLERVGRTRRPAVRIDDGDLGVDDPTGVVRVVIGGEEYAGRLVTDGDGVALRGAFDNPRLARDPGSSPDRLGEWVDREGIDFGRSVLVDVVIEGYRYGLRLPGDRAVYEAVEPPSTSLRDIARGIDG